MDAAISCCVAVAPTRATQKAGAHGVNFGKQSGRSVDVFLHNSGAPRVHRLIAKATPSDKNPKRKSFICTNCDGNGAVLCSQCKGSGVNAVDMFSGQFKAGDSCWLCGGKKDMLCGDCNGAGFVGGFMSTLDE